MNIMNASQFSFSGSFEEQTREILQNVRLTRQEVESLQQLIDDVSQVLSEAWPGCTVLPFGSLVTGLGIKSSDVDCYVELPPWMLPIKKSAIFEAKTSLAKKKDIFNQVFAITNAKVPIVKFFHTPTARYCDISMSSAMGVQNSKLIAYLLYLDQRALKLAIIIKYWSKVYQLSGTNLLPNYCLTLLVIFFLQTKRILPPISILQENACELYIDGWNVGFNEIPYQNSNNDSLYKLMGEFFKYYHSFKYEQFIISPFLGQPVPRELFTTTDAVPMQFSLYRSLVGPNQCQSIRLNSFMCVQDPIQHTRNCSVAVYPRLVQKLLIHFAAASEFYDENNDITFLQKLLNNPKLREEPINSEKKPRMRQMKTSRIVKNKVTKTFTINDRNKKKYKMMT